MSEKVEIKSEALPDLDDLLQCPVCYEIPAGQIFQCNEGHHVCGRCKIRLDVCPVCRALFFGTRNYAMEELIANVRKLRAFKLGGKVTTGSSSDTTPAAEDITTEVPGTDTSDEENNQNLSSSSSLRPPQACKGLFRCLCCKNGNGERLPSARLLNHLRYFHSPELLEGQSENGEYVQAWQFPTVPGRIVTAVRVTDMGIFFLIIEISNDSVCAWLSMAAAPWVAHDFCYTVTISGNDREAIFSDCVWSVRSCEGSLKKRGHCLMVNGSDARALTAPVSISGKLSVRRAPTDQQTHQTQPRAVLRVASRGNTRNAAPAHDLEPFLQDLQNDVARLSRAFATLGREANALVRSEAEMRTRIENGSRMSETLGPNDHTTPSSEMELQPAVPNDQNAPTERTHMSRNARRRMRQRLRAALNATPPPERTPPAQTQRSPGQSAAVTQRRSNNANSNHVQHYVSGLAIVQPPPPSAPASRTNRQANPLSQRQNGRASHSPVHMTGFAVVQQTPASHSAPAQRSNRQPAANPQRQNSLAVDNPVQQTPASNSVPAQRSNRQPVANPQRQNSLAVDNPIQHFMSGLAIVQPTSLPVGQRGNGPNRGQNGRVGTNPVQRAAVGPAVAQQPSITPQPSSGPSDGQPQIENHARTNKKKRRSRR